MADFCSQRMHDHDNTLDSACSANTTFLSDIGDTNPDQPPSSVYVVSSSINVGLVCHWRKSKRPNHSRRQPKVLRDHCLMLTCVVIHFLVSVTSQNINLLVNKTRVTNGCLGMNVHCLFNYVVSSWHRKLHRANSTLRYRHYVQT